MIPGIALIQVFLDGNLFALAIASFLLLSIGRSALQGDVKAMLAGQAAGLVVLLLWLAGSLGTGRIQDAGDLLEAVLRAAISAMFATGTAWLVLFPIVVTWSSKRRERAWTWLSSRFERRPRTFEPAGYLDYQSDPVWDHPVSSTAGSEDELPPSRDQQEQFLFELYLFYDRHRGVLQERFPEDLLKTRLESFVSEEATLETVRQRVESLRQVFQELVERSQTGEQPRDEFASAEEAVRHFQAERKRIMQMDVDEETLESLLVAFDEARDQALEAFIRSFNERGASHRPAAQAIEEPAGKAENVAGGQA